MLYYIVTALRHCIMHYMKKMIIIISYCYEYRFHVDLHFSAITLILVLTSCLCKNLHGEGEVHYMWGFVCVGTDGGKHQ